MNKISLLILLCSVLLISGCQLQPSQMKDDLDFLFKTIEEVHPNMYAYTPKEEFDRYRDVLYSEINKPMTFAEFYKHVAPAVTHIKDGHTWVRTNNIVLPWDDRFFPLLCLWQNEELIIHQNVGSSDIPIGAAILSINGEKISEVLERISKYRPEETKHGNVHRAAKDLGQLLRLEYGPIDKFVIKVRVNDGNIQKYEVRTVSFSKLREYETKSASGKESCSYRFLPDYNTGILEINTFGNDTLNYKTFLKNTFQKINVQKAKNLIIDIRKNEGGDSLQGELLLKYLTGRPFMQFERADEKISVQADNLQRIRQYKSDEDIQIGSVVTWPGKPQKPGANPLRFYGKKYVLVGCSTFSSANCFASAIKCFNIGTIIGEETGGKTANFGDIYNFKLPNSKLSVQVSKKYFVEACGKPDGRGLLPDYEVKQKPEDTAKGVDTVLQFTLNLIKDSNSVTLAK